MNSSDLRRTARKSSNKERPKWTSGTEFFLTTLCYNFGIGNLWRFPVLCCQHGGFSFLVPYLFCLGFLGIPILFLEMAIGQYSALGITLVWKCCPPMKGIGIGMALSNALLAINFVALAAQIMLYFVYSLSTRLPFVDCGNYWNSFNCTDSKNRAQLNSPCAEFYFRNILNQDESSTSLGYPDYRLTAMLILCWTLSYVVLSKSVQSLGKAAWLFTIIPFFLLITLVVGGCFMRKALNGLYFCMHPQWKVLIDYNTWAEAAYQVVFSLGIGTGPFTVLASYNQFDKDILLDSVIIALVNLITSILAGFAIFSILGFFAHEADVDLNSLIEHGPRLAFIIFPEALSYMPVSSLWSSIFFLLLLFLVLGTVFIQLETVITSFQDECPLFRNQGAGFRVIVCAFGFILSLPLIAPGASDHFYLFTTAAAGVNCLVLSFFMVVAIQFVYGFNRFSDDVMHMLGRRLNCYWRYCYLSAPFALLVIILVALLLPLSSSSPATAALCIPGQTRVQPCSPWSLLLAWVLFASTLIWIPIVFVASYASHSGCWANITEMVQPKDWGPSVPDCRGQLEDIDTSKEKKKILRFSEASRFS